MSGWRWANDRGSSITSVNKTPDWEERLPLLSPARDWNRRLWELGPLLPMFNADGKNFSPKTRVTSNVRCTDQPDSPRIQERGEKTPEKAEFNDNSWGVRIKRRE